MVAAVSAEIIDRFRRIGGNTRANRAFAVEDAQRVGLQPLAAGGAKLGLVRAEIVHKRCTVSGTAVGAADGIEVERAALQAQPAQHAVGQRDDLRVALRPVGAVQLGAELEKLAAAAGLRLLIAEKVGQIIELERHRTGVQPVFDDAAGHARRALRPQRQAAPVAVGEGVHLLLHDVGRAADAAVEQLGRFKGGEADFLEPARGGLAADDVLRVAPRARLRRQDVQRAARLFDVCHLRSIPFFLTLLRQSRSPRSSAIISASAVAMLVATGMLCKSHRRTRSHSLSR